MLDVQREFIEILFQKYLDDKCTRNEIRILLQHFDAGEKEEVLKNLIRQQSDFSEESSPVLNEKERPRVDDIFHNIKNTIAAAHKTGSTYVLPFYRKTWFRVCAAATMIVAVSISALYLLPGRNERLLAHQENQTNQANKILPGTNNAVLTLDDGTTIILDNEANGPLAQQGNVQVLKSKGQVAYKNGNQNMMTEVVFNTITTSNGNEYKLILSDGSKVWLNAASSIRFPVSFTGNERNVEITGEAYFEIAPDRTKPFQVNVDNMQVNVLGTHFNVNAYSDENCIKTSLLEGSVKITKGGLSDILKPGQQGILTKKGDNMVIIEADVNEAVAWKNGLFQFAGAGINSVMKEIGRWYDVEIVYDGKVPDRNFEGKISRSAHLSDVLKILELANVKFTVVGKKIIVHEDNLKKKLNR